MEIDFKEMMAAKSDEYLTDYVANRMKYRPVAVQAAISELESRGRIFTEEEHTTIQTDLDKKHEEIKNQNKPGAWAQNIVTDKSAPSYYSKLVIWLFSIFFGIPFGIIFLTINIRKTGNKKATESLVILGTLYFITECILIRLPQMRFISIVLDILGAYLLTEVFWNKYLGKNVQYRFHPIWIPLIICGILKVFFLYVYFTRV